MMKTSSHFWNWKRLMLKTNVYSSILYFIIVFYYNQVLVVLSHSVGVPPLLLVSFNGIRYDYLSKFQTLTPNLNKIKQEGVYAINGVKNVFGTSTIPNQWSVVTGLYPENHGMVMNHMYDPNLKKEFIPPWWNRPDHHNDYRFYDSGGEPIWVTSQLHSSGSRSGSVMWLGSDQPIKWVQPTLNMFSDENVSNEFKIDTVVSWFTQKHHINLGLIYFDGFDEITQSSEINSAQMENAIKEVDSIIGSLLYKLVEIDMLDDINIIITSDHGSVNLPKSKYILLDDIIPADWYDMILTSTPLFSVIPKSGMEDTLYEKLKIAADQPNSHFKVYKKEDIPERFHFKHNDRVPPIVALADIEYTFIVNQTADSFKQGHGYDNEYKEMWPLFMALGPSFKKGFSVDSFEIVDIYPLMCHLMHLHPAPNNGSLEIVSALLMEHETSMWTFATYIIVLIVISSVGGVYLVAACRQRIYLKRKIIHMNSPGKVTFSSSRGAAAVRLLDDIDAEDDEEDELG